MNLGDKIKILRKKNNLSQEQLAEKLNVSRQAISKWESNIAYPDISNLILLREIFGVTLDYLVIDSKIESEDINESVNSSNDKKWYKIKLKSKKRNYEEIEEDNEEEEDIVEDEDDCESDLMIAGLTIGTAVGVITGNFLWATAGSFLGLGVGYILKNIKINSN